MPNTFIKIQTITVGTAIGTMSFSSIPATYTDLALYISGRSDRNSGTQSDLQLRFNSASANYSHDTLQGNGSTASSTTGSSGTFGSLGAVPQDTDTASVFGSSFVYIPNYTNANHKFFIANTVRENNSTSCDVRTTFGVWADTSAITSITLYTESNTQLFKQYSTATLYGIKSS